MQWVLIIKVYYVKIMLRQKTTPLDARCPYARCQMLKKIIMILRRR